MPSTGQSNPPELDEALNIRYFPATPSALSIIFLLQMFVNSKWKRVYLDKATSRLITLPEPIKNWWTVLVCFFKYRINVHQCIPYLAMHHTLNHKLIYFIHTNNCRTGGDILLGICLWITRLLLFSAVSNVHLSSWYISSICSFTILFLAIVLYTWPCFSYGT